MKRMNLIRAALFAVVVFVGSSLSAQGNWVPSDQALQNIDAALVQLNESPVKQPGQQPGQLISSHGASTERMKTNCPDCLSNIVKVRFLTLVAEQIKQGVSVGTAVSNVRDLMLGGLPQGNNMTSQMQGHINAAFLFATDLLS
jgi:hypothetical protein